MEGFCCARHTTSPHSDPLRTIPDGSALVTKAIIIKKKLFERSNIRVKTSKRAYWAGPGLFYKQLCSNANFFGDTICWSTKWLILIRGTPPSWLSVDTNLPNLSRIFLCLVFLTISVSSFPQLFLCRPSTSSMLTAAATSAPRSWAGPWGPWAWTPPRTLS